MEDRLKLITEKEAELKPLYDRMDSDRKAVHLEKYILTGFDTYANVEIPRTVSITMNKPAVFAHAVKAVLAGAKEQTIVEGLSEDKNKKIKTFIENCRYTIDQRLRQEKRIVSLKDWLCDHVTKRGPIGARWLFDENGLPNCLPVDMRYCPFEDDKDGLAWAANHTRRSGKALIKEYE